MEWNIITGSKGGVGKTLLSLLLLGLNSDRNNGSTLFLDLNATNTDSSAILLSGEPENYFTINLSDGLENISEDIKIQKCCIVGENREYKYFYGVGWARNPFGLYNPNLFAQLLSFIKQNEKEIGDYIGSPINNVIIDTNYHFCNIFGKEDSDYDIYKTELLRNEKFNIWFMWVYRQLDKLINKAKDEANIVTMTAAAMENHLKNSNSNITPFIHVFSPISLISAQNIEKGQVSILSKNLLNIFGKSQKDYIITEIQKLADLQVSESLEFEKWIKLFGEAKKQLLQHNNDPHLLLIDILYETIQDLKTRPKNLVPLWAYINKLQYYTDTDNSHIVRRIKGLTKLYQDNFVKLLR